MFNQRFNIIKSKLQNIAALKYIEWDFDQSNKEGGIVNTPCVFIDFSPAKIKRLTKMTEEVTLDFTVTLHTENLKARVKLTDNSNPHFAIEEQIQEQLKSYEKTGFEPMSKIPSGMLKSSISYQMHFTQGTSLGKTHSQNSTPAIDIYNLSVE